MSTIRILVENFEANEEQIAELSRRSRELIQQAIELVAQHKLGDIVEGKRSASGQPERMKVIGRFASLSMGNTGTPRITVRYDGKAIKRDGTPGQIACYLYETHVGV